MIIWELLLNLTVIGTHVIHFVGCSNNNFLVGIKVFQGVHFRIEAEPSGKILKHSFRGLILLAIIVLNADVSSF